MEKEGLGSEELVGLANNDATHMAKGKRTKRLRLLSPCGVAATVMTSSCSSASADHGGGGDEYGSFSSSTTTDQEEEDMANCLILLAQGGGDSHLHHHHHQEHRVEDHDHGDGKKIAKGSISSNGSRKFSEMATATTVTKVGFYIYECKTCNRTFPSFQALGGHRASHKKPKVTVEEKKQQPPPPLSPPQQQVVANFDHFEETHIKSGPQISLQLGQRAFNGTNKAKIHECSICGSEFTSGQALGGHMRRHRASSTSITAQAVAGIETSCDAAVAAAVAVEVQPRNILELDLNLPAPEEETKFQFTATQKPMVLSAAPALVDCHY